MKINFNKEAVINQVCAWEKSVTQKAANASQGFLIVGNGCLSLGKIYTCILVGLHTYAAAYDLYQGNSLEKLSPCVPALFGGFTYLAIAKNRVQTANQAEFKNLKDKILKAINAQFEVIYEKSTEANKEELIKFLGSTNLNSLTLEFKRGYPLTTDEEINQFATNLLLPFSVNQIVLSIGEQAQ